MKATQDLKDEHEGIKVMLSILEKVSEKLETTRGIDKGHFDGILEFLTIFVDKCHHGKEEDLLFPAMTAASDQVKAPVAVMRAEHETGRGYIGAMARAYDAYLKGDRSVSGNIAENARGYISLLGAHIEKENNILFEMADRLFSEEKQNELWEGFEKIEEERIGRGKHEEFHGLLDRLSEIYL
ncbi:MAG: hemerythrin domain-containing protein [Syntrophorhabdaceae bacterium]|nr:hemerythrin domain-containing protein [Syntrophorhabdaceae bacterium]MDD4196630.1 hemerythrin domain-containing protein [Syntrophorhabdaceae bacterium]HOC45610.1 hemerythrin domain-containing protein [Syntrophorhabdaceae bacterium]